MLNYRTCRSLITEPSFAHPSGGYSISADSFLPSNLLKLILLSLGILLIIALAGQNTTVKDFSFVYYIESSQQVGPVHQVPVYLQVTVLCDTM